MLYKKYNDKDVTQQEQIRNLEIDWVDKLRDQIDFANVNVLTEFRLRLKICRTRSMSSSYEAIGEGGK